MSKPWIVMKFGGSSVAAARYWPIILNLCQAKISQGKNVLVVLSALKNVSNTLEALILQALSGVHVIAIQRLKEYHFGFASELGLDGANLLDNLFEELTLRCEKINNAQTIKPEDYAKVLAYGELLSTTLGAAYLFKHSQTCQWLDVRKILKTSPSSVHQGEGDWHHFLSAECNYEFDPELVTRYQSDADLLVTQGFIATDLNNKTVLLGREGSDTSAAYLAAILGAKKIEIWTDVAGVYTTNPRELPSARRLKNLSYDDARRMANFGAKVLHPKALIPAEKNHIEVVVNDISKPERGGTTIHSHSNAISTSPFAVVVRKKVTQIKFNHEKTKISNALEALGYDILLDCSDFKKNYKHQLFLRYVDTTSPEPEQQSIQALFDLNENITKDVNSFEIKYAVGVLTIVGKESGEWIHNVECYIQQNLKVDSENIFSFPESGRISIILNTNLIMKTLIELHLEFIENSKSDIFGKSWDENAD